MNGFIEQEAVGPGWGLGQEKKKFTVKRSLFNVQVVMQIQWCAKGAEMNIIQHVWDRMKVNLSKLSLELANSDQLWEAIEHDWKRLQRDTAIIEALYASLPQRMEVVNKVSGGMTRY